MSTVAIHADRGDRTGRVMLNREAMKEEDEQRQILRDYVNKHMVEGTDYGIIPGTDKKTLLKPGAEKLTALFHCVPRFKVVKEIEDWDRGLFYYRVRCLIVTKDRSVVAEGMGAGSTWESKYRFRNQSRTCPNCGKASIIKGKAEYGGGWICWAKKDGCGAKFGDDDDQAISSQDVGRIDNPDIYDAINTVLKMSKKRSHVDAALMLSRCSDIFTQDAEDLPESQEIDDRPKQQQQQRAAQQPPKQQQSKPAQQQQQAERPQEPEVNPPYIDWRTGRNAPAPTKDEFLSLIARKGWILPEVLRAINEKWRTKYEHGKTVWERMNVAHTTDFAQWVWGESDAQSATPAQSAVKQEQPQEPDRGDAFETPKDGWELYAYVTKADADMTKAGLCKLTDLVAHIVKAGSEAGFKPVDIIEWNNPAQIKAVLGWCDVYRADRERDRAAKAGDKSAAAEPLKTQAGELIT